MSFAGEKDLRTSDAGSEVRILYQSFILLTQLRNLLIYYKPKEEVTLASSEDYQKAFEEYEKKVTGRFAFDEKMQGEGFLYRCFSKDCARWSFKVSREFTDRLSDTLCQETHSAHPLAFE